MRRKCFHVLAAGIDDIQVVAGQGGDGHRHVFDVFFPTLRRDDDLLSLPSTFCAGLSALRQGWRSVTCKANATAKESVDGRKWKVGFMAESLGSGLDSETDSSELVGHWFAVNCTIICSDANLPENDSCILP